MKKFNLKFKNSLPRGRTMEHAWSEGTMHQLQGMVLPREKLSQLPITIWSTNYPSFKPSNVCHKYLFFILSILMRF